MEKNQYQQNQFASNYSPIVERNHQSIQKNQFVNNHSPIMEKNKQNQFASNHSPVNQFNQPPNQFASNYSPIIEKNHDQPPNQFVNNHSPVMEKNQYQQNQFASNYSPIIERNNQSIQKNQFINNHLPVENHNQQVSKPLSSINNQGNIDELDFGGFDDHLLESLDLDALISSHKNQKKPKNVPFTEKDVNSASSIKNNEFNAKKPECCMCANIINGRPIVCAQCEQSFHSVCLKIRFLPKSDWYCVVCKPKDDEFNKKHKSSIRRKKRMIIDDSQDTNISAPNSPQKVQSYSDNQHRYHRRKRVIIDNSEDTDISTTTSPQKRKIKNSSILTTSESPIIQKNRKKRLVQQFIDAEAACTGSIDVDDEGGDDAFESSFINDDDDESDIAGMALYHRFSMFQQSNTPPLF